MRRIVHRVAGVDIPMGVFPSGMQVLLAPMVSHSNQSLQGMERLELVLARIIHLQSSVAPNGNVHAILDDMSDMMRDALVMLTESEL